MEKVRAFDRELVRQNEYAMMMTRVISYIFGFFGVLFACLAIGDFQERWLPFAAVALYMQAVQWYLRPFMLLQDQKKKNISIYEQLRFTPARRNEIAAVRREYLSDFCLKISLLNLILGQIVGLATHQWSLMTLICPAVINVIVWVSGLLFIHLPTWADLRQRRF